MEMDRFLCTFTKAELAWEFTFQGNIVSGHFCPTSSGMVDGPTACFGVGRLQMLQLDHSPVTPANADLVWRGIALVSSKTSSVTFMQTR